METETLNVYVNTRLNQIDSNHLSDLFNLPAHQDAAFVALCKSAGIDDADMDSVKKVLAIDIARSRDCAIGNTPVCSIISDSYSTGGIRYSGIGDYQAIESFNPLNDHLHLKDVVKASMARWVPNTMMSHFPNKPCTEPTLRIPSEHVIVRRIGESSQEGRSAIAVLKDPRILEDTIAKIVPSAAVEGIDTDGVFPNRAIVDISEVTITNTNAMVIDSTDILSSNLLLKAVFMTISYRANGTGKSYNFKLDVPSVYGRFGQKVNGDSSDRINSSTTTRSFNGTKLNEMNLGTMQQELLLAIDDVLTFKVTPSICINLNSRSYTPSAAATVTGITGIGITEFSVVVDGYDIDMSYAQDNLRRNNIIVEGRGHNGTFDIPQGLVVSENKMIGNDHRLTDDVILSKMSTIASASVDNRTLQAIMATIDNMELMLDEFYNIGSIPDPSLQFASGGSSTACVIKTYIDASEIFSYDDARRLEAIRTHMTLFLQNIIGRMKSTSMMMHSVKPGQRVVWTIFAHPTIVGNLFSIESKEVPETKNIRKLPTGDMYRTVQIDDNTIGSTFIVCPIIEGGSEISPLSMGIVADCGTGVYDYQGGIGNARTKGRSVCNRSVWIPTNVVAAMVDVQNLDKVAFIN